MPCTTLWESKGACVDVQDEDLRAGKTVQLLGQLGVGVPRSAGDAAKRLCVDEQHARLVKLLQQQQQLRRPAEAAAQPL